MALPAFSIGVDVGGTHMRVAQISREGAILHKKVVNGSRNAAEAVEIITALIADMGGREASGIGVGIPGRVDGHTGEILSGGFLNLAGVDLKGKLHASFGRPVTIANDCNMAILGEARSGSARGFGTVVMMTIGTGIGGAMMERGRIVTGRRCAGQLGHIIVRQDGEPCLCGGRGCVETESSGTALRRHMSAAGFSATSRFEDVLELAEAEDARAQHVLQAWIGPLRSVIHSLSATLDPEVVILGGGMGKAAVRALDFLPNSKSWYDVTIKPALLGDDAGVIGAGLAAFDVGQSAKTGKTLVMVNGVPASGKSSVALGLAEATGWPVFGLDTIKNPHLEMIENVDREFNRLLGRASYKAIFSLIKEQAEGATVIVDAWFGFQPVDLLRQHMVMAGISQVVEIWCHAPPAVIGERYRQRAAGRLAGHPGAAYVPELITLAERASPLRLGPLLDVDTTRPKDVEAIAAWVMTELGR